MGGGYSGLLTRYPAVRFPHLVEGFDLSKDSLMVRSIFKATKRLCPVAKKMPSTVELVEWIRINFIDASSVGGNQLWAALMAGFFFCLRMSEIENLRENDVVAQSVDGEVSLSIRIRKSKNAQDARGALGRFYLPGALYSTALLLLYGSAGRWGNESGGFLAHRMILRLA